MTQEKKSRLIRIVQVLLAIFIIADVILRVKAITTSPKIPVPNVVVQKPKLMPVVEYMTQTGTVIAYNSVNLVARVQGYLNEITFVDGTIIKKGDPLFVIEPEPYLAQVREAEASVAALRAANTYANAEYARQQKMYKENATSLNNVEKWFAQSQQSKAEVDKALANLEIAKINYSYTHIQAPFDGRIGRHLVDAGNLVGNGVATNLATIEQLDPIYVYFNLNELDWLKLRQAAQKKGIKDDPKILRKIPVYLSLQGQHTFNFAGNLDFINTGLNASTGTMELRALLPNKDFTLLPNLFVQVRLPITSPAPMLTIPNTAVLYDQIGAYVLVMDKTNHVLVKRVVLGSVDDAGNQSIQSGLDKDDLVIVSGLQNATPGNLVAPTSTQNKGGA